MVVREVPWDIDTHCWDDLVDTDTTSVYDAYSRPLGLGSRLALLAIDLYERAFAGGARPPKDLQAEHGSSCGVYAHAALPFITEVFHRVRGLGVPVLHTTASRAPAFSATNRTAGEDPHLVGFHEACRPEPGELVIEKERASAFYGTPLLSELVRRRVDTVVLIGESTSGCVRASAVDAYSNGFHVVVVEDAVFDRSWMVHCANLFDLHHKYVDVLRKDTFLKLLDGSPT